MRRSGQRARRASISTREPQGRAPAATWAVEEGCGAAGAAADKLTNFAEHGVAAQAGWLPKPSYGGGVPRTFTRAFRASGPFERGVGAQSGRRSMAGFGLTRNSGTVHARAQCSSGVSPTEPVCQSGAPWGPISCLRAPGKGLASKVVAATAGHTGKSIRLHGARISFLSWGIRPAADSGNPSCSEARRRREPSARRDTAAGATLPPDDRQDGAHRLPWQGRSRTGGRERERGGMLGQAWPFTAPALEPAVTSSEPTKFHLPGYHVDQTPWSCPSSTGLLAAAPRTHRPWMRIA